MSNRKGNIFYSQFPCWVDKTLVAYTCKLKGTFHNFSTTLLEFGVGYPQGLSKLFLIGVWGYLCVLK